MSGVLFSAFSSGVVFLFEANRNRYKFLSVLVHSDKPGVHNFDVLKKLVLPDGSILRARHAGRPTCDCLFDDPVMDGKRFVCSLIQVFQFLHC
jgi:hypothetical protein